MAAWLKVNMWFRTCPHLNSTIFVVLLFLPTLALGQQEYCQITPEHTLCNLPETGPGCDGSIETQGIEEDDISIIVDIHNKIRAKVANGEEGNQPPASNMKRMEWDEELAEVAQRWANQCSLNSGKPHDCNQCRAVSRFPVGQNALYSAASVAQKFDFAQRIQAMATDEIPLVTPSQLERFYSSAAGHYTQIVWADTCKVGCGLTAVKGTGYSYFTICNYGPGGNTFSQPVYRQGEACSECPEDHVCSADYPGLCEPSDKFGETDSQNSDDSDSQHSDELDDSGSQNSFDSKSKYLDDSDSQHSDDSESQLVYDPDSQNSDNSDSQSLDDSDSQLVYDPDSQHSDDADSQLVLDPDSQHSDDSDFQQVYEIDPQQPYDSDSQHSDDSDSQSLDDSDSQQLYVSDPQHSDDSDSQHSDDSDSEQVYDSDSQHSDDSDSEHYDDPKSQNYDNSGVERPKGKKPIELTIESADGVDISSLLDSPIIKDRGIQTKKRCKSRKTGRIIERRIAKYPDGKYSISDLLEGLLAGKGGKKISKQLSQLVKNSGEN